MYDKIYVAGQAAIDRYKNNDVAIPSHKFKIVGRPQVEKIELADSSITHKKEITVLYAPTWRGHFKDANYSSIPYFEPLLELLLARGIRIIFRPHAYATKDPVLAAQIKKIHSILKEHRDVHGVEHIYGNLATRKMSIYDCFNASDLMIADVSSVVIDFLFSEKPLVLMESVAAPIDSMKNWPLSEAAYLIELDDTKNWDVALDKILREDPKKENRLKAKKHYLGDFEHHSYARNFIEAVKFEIESKEFSFNE